MTKEPDRSTFASSSGPGAELVLGVVAPVGADVDYVERALTERLKHFKYALHSIRLSSLIALVEGGEVDPGGESYYDYVSSRMDAGNRLREKYRSDVLALAAINAVRLKRNGEAPRSFSAYFLRSLKHPDEVRTLREVYGPGFFLVGISSSKRRRLEYLCRVKDVELDQAKALLVRDESEPEGHGQRTRDAFQLADAFVSLDANEEVNNKQIWRLLDLLFGQPFITPSADEYAMFMAYAASLRSADLSRQVGAVVVSEGGELIGSGANDVPRARGGLYWADDYVDWPKDAAVHDKRDWVRGYDSNRTRQMEIIEDVAERLLDAARKRLLSEFGRLDIPEEIRSRLSEVVGAEIGAQFDAQNALAGSSLMDLTEYGRAVHAEMAALISCTRIGTSTLNAALYCTTFPCHNCTKHLVAAGIRTVYYIEPYPKSFALTLHGDAVELIGGEFGSESSADMVPGLERVTYRPFNGVGPRKFLDLFSISLSTGRPVLRKQYVPKNWARAGAQLRVSMVPTSYLEREKLAFNVLSAAKLEKSRIE
jgi:deoxycytidylate deaminase